MTTSFSYTVKYNYQAHIFKVDNGYQLELVCYELRSDNEIKVSSMLNEIYLTIQEVLDRLNNFFKLEEPE